MSRFSSRSVTAAAVVLTLSWLAVPAHAAPGPKDPPAGPVRDIVAPVRDIIAPVREIEVASSDLRGAARVEEADRKVDVTLSSEVFFGKDSAKFRPGVNGRLREIAAALRRRLPGSVRIVGYTNDLGTKAHGLVLSRQRAAAVSRVLRPVLPAADYPFTVLGRGEADPAVPNTSEKNRRLNRRVELSYRASR